jgi:hypothetical protein
MNGLTTVPNHQPCVEDFDCDSKSKREAVEQRSFFALGLKTPFTKTLPNYNG